MERRFYTLAEMIELAERFELAGEVFMRSLYGSGHINDTFAVETKAPHPHGARMKRYILQKINTDVFKHPLEVMENIRRVTEKQHESIIAEGGDPLRESLTLVNTKEGECCYLRKEDETYWRCYHFIEGARIYGHVPDNDFGKILVYQAARAFGQFQNQLADLSCDVIHETIVNFHNTPFRIRQLEKAIEINYENRVNKCQEEIEFAREHYHIAPLILDLIENGKVPRRVCHNDTKINNVMFDYTGGAEKAIAVIDLDTVMPGSSLYDFGDMVRTFTCPVEEDDRDLSNVYVSMPLFENLVRGWLETIGDRLTPDEITNLPLAGELITLNIGMRFLADYLKGDQYFQIQRKDQNLDRVRIQFAMINSMNKQKDKMREIVEGIAERLLNR